MPTFFKLLTILVKNVENRCREVGRTFQDLEEKN